MAAVLARLRAELRRRWVSWLGIALVAGLGGGVVLGLLAGAARTTRAYPEFVRAMSAADVLVGGNSPFVLQEGRLGGAVDLDDIAALPQVADEARASVSLLFTGDDGDGSPRGARRSPADHPRRRTARLDHRTLVDGGGTPGQPEAGQRGHRQLRARRAPAPRGRQHLAAPLRRGFGIRDHRAPAPEQLRRSPRRRPRRQQHVDRRARRRTRRHDPDHRYRSVAARIPAARPRPVTRPAPHPRVRAALRAPDRVEPDHVRAPQAARPVGRVRQGHRAAGAGLARGLHREPRAAAAEGRDRDPGRGHRPPPRRAARGAGAGVHRRPGPAPPGVRGGA